MPKNVCMLVHSNYPADPRVRKSAEALVRNGYSVDVIALRDEGEKEEEVINDVNIFRLPLSRGGRNIPRLVYEYFAICFLAFIKLNNLDATRHYDYIHIHTPPDFLVFAAKIQKLKGKTIILDLHEVMSELMKV